MRENAFLADDIRSLFVNEVTWPKMWTTTSTTETERSRYVRWEDVRCRFLPPFITVRENSATINDGSQHDAQKSHGRRRWSAEDQSSEERLQHPQPRRRWRDGATRAGWRASVKWVFKQSAWILYYSSCADWNDHNIGEFTFRNYRDAPYTYLSNKYIYLRNKFLL